MSPRPWSVLALVLAACSGTVFIACSGTVFIACSGHGPATTAQFEAARAQVLAEPLAAAADWQPDGVVDLSNPLLQGVTAAALDAADLPDLPSGARAELDFAVSHWTAGSCETCAVAPLAARGAIVQGKKRYPLAFSARGAVEIRAEAAGDRHRVLATLHRLDDLVITEGPEGMQAEIAAWLQGVPAALGPVPVLSLERGEMAREIRLKPDPRGLRVHVLTDAHAPLAALPDMPEEGWSAAVSQVSLAAALRRRALREQDGAAVVFDPTAWSTSGPRFSLDLRCWTLAEGGKAAWQDLHSWGALGVVRGKLEVRIEGVEQWATSPDPIPVNPHVALAGIDSHAAGSLEASMGAILPHPEGPVEEVVVQRLSGVDGRLELRGDVKLAPRPAAAVAATGAAPEPAPGARKVARE